MWLRRTHSDGHCRYHRHELGSVCLMDDYDDSIPGSHCGCHHVLWRCHDRSDRVACGDDDDDDVGDEGFLHRLFPKHR